MEGDLEREIAEAARMGVDYHVANMDVVEPIIHRMSKAMWDALFGGEEEIDIKVGDVIVAMVNAQSDVLQLLFYQDDMPPREQAHWLESVIMTTAGHYNLWLRDLAASVSGKGIEP